MGLSMPPLFQRFLSENNGNPSSTRLVMVLAYVVILGGWITVSIEQKAMQPLPTNILELLGLVTVGKVFQKFGEAKPEADSSKANP